MNFLYYGTENVDCECINRTIFDGNIMNMTLIITKVNYRAIDADNDSFRGYYITRFSSSPYTLQEDLNIY